MDKKSTASAVLARTLAHVPFEGWTRRALELGAAEAGHADDLIRVFPGGVADALKLFAAESDEKMRAAWEALEPKPKKIREKIATLVRLRLQALTPHREAARRALAAYALPLNMPHGFSALHRTVDSMWALAGDASTDFNWYSKRTLLAGVYTSTLLVWLNDRSEGNADTWAFLTRRIEDVMRIQRFKMPNVKKQMPN